jgi:hypothetical protein
MYCFFITAPSLFGKKYVQNGWYKALTLNFLERAHLRNAGVACRFATIARRDFSVKGPGRHRERPRIAYEENPGRKHAAHRPVFRKQNMPQNAVKSKYLDRKQVTSLLLRKPFNPFILSQQGNTYQLHQGKKDSLGRSLKESAHP